MTPMPLNPKCGYIKPNLTHDEKIAEAKKVGLFVEDMTEPCSDCGNLDFKVYPYWRGGWEARCAYCPNFSGGKTRAEAIANWNENKRRLRSLESVA